MAIEIVGDLERMRNTCERLRNAGKIIGLVPTMGALHEGHLSLVRIARERADTVVVSIYVNPAQFSTGEDLESYPRVLERDVSLLQSAGADYVFTPGDAMMYPSGFATYVVVGGLTEGLCGRSRPTHFRGVTTVVSKLFNIVRPHVAVFGEKDAQQLAVIRRMTRDLDFGVKIIGAPIVREPDGLAMSSRNAYLTPEERQGAAVLNKSLREAERLAATGETSAGEILARVRETISQSPLAAIDYLELVDTDTLQPLTEVTGTGLLALAVRFGKTRLIDNTVLRVTH